MDLNPIEAGRPTGMNNQPPQIDDRKQHLGPVG
jgi:hypothetical protein